MSRTPRSVRWNRLYAIQDFVGVGKCWQRGCGSYCCKTEHEDFRFRFIRSGMVYLPMCPQEYQHLVAQDKLQDYDKGNITTYGMEFLPGKRAVVYMMRCKCAGSCLAPEFRPLICKIYPYLPVPDAEGNIAEFIPGSVFDVARSMIDDHHACPVRAEDNEVHRQNLTRNCKGLFCHPHVIFYFRAAKDLMDVMCQTLRSRHPDVLDLPVGEFFSRWETLYATQQLFPVDAVRERLAENYRQVARVWGGFETE